MLFPSSSVEGSPAWNTCTTSNDQSQPSPKLDPKSEKNQKNVDRKAKENKPAVGQWRAEADENVSVLRGGTARVRNPRDKPWTLPLVTQQYTED